VAWVSTNSSGVSFRMDPFKVTLVKVGRRRGRGGGGQGRVRECELASSAVQALPLLRGCMCTCVGGEAQVCVRVRESVE
jgi:hypothetical protein